MAINKYEVLAFVDTHVSEPGEMLLGIPVIHPSEIKSYHFDEIIVASSFFDEIASILKDESISEYASCEDVAAVQNLLSEKECFEELMRKKELSWIPRDLRLYKKHIKDAQLIEDRAELLELLPKSGVVAEIGVDQGDFSCEIISRNRPRLLHLIDSWDTERYGQSKFDRVQKKLSRAIDSGQVQVLRRLSQEAADYYPDFYFDWVYIDTTHSYVQTKQELALYSKKIKPKGFIAGHDYLMGNWSSGFRYGVMEAVHEFCKEHDYRIVYLTMDLGEGQSFAIQRIDYS